jgi:hypothetical protein
MDARTLFKDMLRTEVAPALRELGLRGSGQKFRLPTGSETKALIDFCRSGYNTSDHCRFSLLVSYLDADVSRADTAWSADSGQFMEPPHEHWWTITSPGDVEPVADHVVAVVRDMLLPQLRARVEGATPPEPARVDFEHDDCPWPYCTNELDLYEDGDLDLDRVEADPFRGMETAHLEPEVVEDLRQFRTTLTPRTRAWKVLHISRRRLDDYADRVGAGDELDFGELLTVALLGVDDLHSPEQWRQAARVIRAWLDTGTDAGLDPGAALVVSDERVAVTGTGEAMSSRSATGWHGVYMLQGAVRDLLAELRARSTR